MPAAIPLIAGIATIAGAGTSIGLGIDQALNQPGTPKPGPTAPTGPSVGQTQAALAPQALTIESLTGGSVSPDYLASIAPTLAGVAGQPNTNPAMQAILQQILGTNAAPTPSLASPGTSNPSFNPVGMPVNLSALSASPGASDFLTKLAGGIS